MSCGFDRSITKKQQEIVQSFSNDALSAETIATHNDLEMFEVRPLLRDLVDKEYLCEQDDTYKLCATSTSN